jgi:hypothetical protein
VSSQYKLAKCHQRHQGEPASMNVGGFVLGPPLEAVSSWHNVARKGSMLVAPACLRLIGEESTGKHRKGNRGKESLSVWLSLFPWLFLQRIVSHQDSARTRRGEGKVLIPALQPACFIGATHVRKQPVWRVKTQEPKVHNRSRLLANCPWNYSILYSVSAGRGVESIPI